MHIFKKSTFHISKMDCPSEEQMIRMKLEPYKEVKQLSFDIPNRKLEVYHTEEVEKIHQALSELKLNDRLESTEDEVDLPLAADESKISGYFQMALALLGFSEVLRRFFSESETPLFQWMIIISVLALVGNLVSLWLINKAKSDEAHMQASAIFTSNDIIVNGGVILAGVLVYFLNSKWPDLAIGAIVFTFVMRGALRILKISK
jgi:cation transport ATPase